MIFVHHAHAVLHMLPSSRPGLVAPAVPMLTALADQLEICGRCVGTVDHATAGTTRRVSMQWLRL